MPDVTLPGAQSVDLGLIDIKAKGPEPGVDKRLDQR
jgi:hypothetical protein